MLVKIMHVVDYDWLWKVMDYNPFFTMVKKYSYFIMTYYIIV
jgi:hypothetical protein